MGEPRQCHNHLLVGQAVSGEETGELKHLRGVHYPHLLSYTSICPGCSALPANMPMLTSKITCRIPKSYTNLKLLLVKR